jgi:hypothetical protein
MAYIIRSLIIALLLYLFIHDQAYGPEADLPCRQWREETQYMIWMDGCLRGVDSIFKEAGQDVHPFGVHDYCHQLFEKRFSVK